MTQEEKQLLLKDLCARLPYSLQIHIITVFQSVEFDDILKYHHLEAFICDRIEIKPYLRPMSSMTAEEKQSYYKLIDNLHFADGSFYSPDIKDWLDEHFFDYRGLIPMGLALEAPEDMYKNG